MFYAIRLVANRNGQCWYTGTNHEHGQGEACWNNAPKLFATLEDTEVFANALTERIGEYSTRRIPSNRVKIVCFEQLQS